MTLLDIPIESLDGTPTTVGEITAGRAALVVNVASRCGLTPQYAALERIHETYASRGFTVIGVPCNQFKDQEPGPAEEIAQFCSDTYGVTFPLTAKVEVNGDGRHQLYAELTLAADQDGRTGDVQWNFEKFLIDANGTVVARFGSRVPPEDVMVILSIEQLVS